MQREASRALEALEGEAGRREVIYIESPTNDDHLIWQKALRELSLYSVKQTKKSMLHSI